MSAFPGSPRLVKGAIVGLDKMNPLSSVVVFQYNPETLKRSLKASTAGEQADMGEVLRLKGPPEETISLEIEIDATDQLEQAQPLAVAMGVYPSLAALEMLLYPKAAYVIANQVLAKLGMIEVVPPEAPMALFAWGVKRVLPVRITGLEITEELYDPSLNPIRAKVSLSMRVLTYDDLGLASTGGALYLAHQLAKEAMATVQSAINLTQLPSTLG
ncbi:MAG: hypothetical protein NTX53_08165 [candidate division WOR-3 bacterium]|nr:hypothetical protein [candidate division WOR-3 bacterium]